MGSWVCRPRFCGVLLCVAWCISLSSAQAETRVWGVGSAVGIGFSYNTIPSVAPLGPKWGPQADLGTLELRIFFENGGSLDLYSQLGNTLISGILASVPRAPGEEGVLFFMSLGLLYNFNIGQGPRRFLLGLGPELGMDIGVGGRYLQTRPVKFHLRVATRVGVEFLVGKQKYGLQLMLRSFFEPLSYAGFDGNETTAPGFGALLELAFVYYRTQSRLSRPNHKE